MTICILFTWWWKTLAWPYIFTNRRTLGSQKNISAPSLFIIPSQVVVGWFMVFNATFNNISVISWQSVLLVEETGVPGENHRPVASQVSEQSCICVLGESILRLFLWFSDLILELLWRGCNFLVSHLIIFRFWVLILSLGLLTSLKKNILNHV